MLDFAQDCYLLQITPRKDFGTGYHTMASEPVFWLMWRERFLYLLMRIAEELPNSTLTTKVHVHRERNESALVTITDTEVDAILTLKAAFDKPIWHVLDKSDSGCPNDAIVE